MRILLIVNPISGRGRAEVRARAVAARLEGAGHAATILPTRPGPAGEWLVPALDGVELLVVVGGDGAVRMAGAATAGSGIPVYHYPCGTENLFAREWRMDRSVETLCGAIRDGRIVDVDLARANGEAFLLMASIGLDAEVVGDLSARRRGGITHFSYALPIVRQLLHWKAPALEVLVDGERIDAGGTGGVIVANCRQYGGRLDPAPEADMTDGRLDVVYLPARGTTAMVGWIARCRLRRQHRGRGFVHTRGREVTVRCAEPVRFQLDGDCPDGGPEARVTELRVEIVPGAMRVLAPAPAGTETDRRSSVHRRP